jgi:hypothetical protein
VRAYRDNAANSVAAATLKVTATNPTPVLTAVAAAIAATPANISMITITMLIMITKTTRETEMIPITATMLKMIIIERIVMRKPKKRRMNVTTRTTMEYVKPSLLRTL